MQATADALVSERALLEQRTDALSKTLQHIDQGILMVDRSGTVAVYNKQVVTMLDLPEELLASQPPFSAVLEHQWRSAEFARTDRTLQDFVRAGGIMDRPQHYERERPNGMAIEVHSQPLEGGGIVRTFTDITQRKLAQMAIERAALFDELTGLPNRLALLRALETWRNAPEGTISLLSISLDRFRLLNNARGHETGDQVLVEAARRLSSERAGDDVVSRVGGDEFAVFHVQRGDDSEPEELPKRLLKRLEEPYVVDGVTLSITASIGVVWADAEASPATLLRQADVALSRAKDAGGDQVAYYTPSMTVAREERFQLEQSLREALGANTFTLAYQPIIAVESGEIVGYESLLRWVDPVRGNISPATFIPIAEATGLIVPLGRKALVWACFEAASWPNERSVAVNLSPAQFERGKIVETVREVLARSGLAPQRLELEITEGMLLEQTGLVLETMTALREIGVGLTIDDFGAGHAGLSYLRRFPFKKMKIDGSFVRSLGKDSASDAIVEAMLLLGKRLNMRVVAEGVETEEQLEQLRRMRCPYVQGYLTGRPMAPELARGL
ncbi:MAG: EAL domain-containing protein [Acetobacteraceae bacterium]|nr:EAL domain-containing protein [Acetobacteraceae bacterium]